ncbi:MAG TPA: 30S ribosomal protein S12 methylthiotransferase RimO [Acidimicrobiales bacterium]|nr:MAG: ribosomal protein S12 methylthiotransferase RimO [Actinobacteria bacterium 21-73-9]HQU25899.1 30S ribosomal protein S12 methylthiotransferase RimO [Acidimicrobiales bacterium]
MRYWIETLGCPKNHVDSEKLAGYLVREGYAPAASAEDAELVVANTCAFIEAAREESIETVLDLAERRRDGARLVVTGCMAERYGDELAAALPEVDLVAGFGRSLTTTPVALRAPTVTDFDLLNLPRPRASAPWAYLKVAEGCDRRCGFCAIPSFRGDQRSRSSEDVLSEARDLVAGGVREVVLVAQDLASWGHDRRRGGRGEALEVLDEGGAQPLVELTRRLTGEVERLRLLYLYPSGLTEGLIEAVLATGVPYFDLSLQHASRPLLRRMRRWGDGERFLERIAAIRRAEPDAAFRSSFILGYPGETEDDHAALLDFLEAAQLDWAGFFTFSDESGTPAHTQDGHVASGLALERLREASEVQDAITARKRDALVGTRQRVLVDAPGVGRTVRECPEIDGVVYVEGSLSVGDVVECTIVASRGTDLEAMLG